MSPAEGTPKFAGSVPDMYEQLMVPMIFAPYARDLVGRLADVTTGALVEIAAGTGVVTRLMAAALPEAVAITATDLNQPMLDRATAEGTARPIRWKQADVMALPFDDASIDVVVCQFGLMFMQPQAQAFAEIHRILKPGGRLLASVWGAIAGNDFANAVMQALYALFPDDPPTFIERTPHGYYQRDRIAADLAAGGFTEPPAIDDVVRPSTSPSAADVATAFCAGTPMLGEIAARGPGALDEAIAVCTAAIAQRFGSVAPSGRQSALVIDVRRAASA